MILTNMLKNLAEAGCTTDQLIAAVSGYESASAEKRNAQREKWRAKKQRQRANVPRDNGGQQGTQGDIGDLSPPSSPSNGFPPGIYNPIYTPPSLTPSSSPTHTRVREGFEIFWKAYPRKTGKGAAEKAWAKATARLDPEVIFSAIAAYPWQEDPQFIPHPATWLNQKRWLDEISVVPQKETLSQYYARLAKEGEDAEANVYPLRRF
ncbi:hypothetical protein UFOVP95_41 [uncultured Caudovirales phage]|uniref:Uncharacterized protein n=1 Tax=uncultured Caudovirales phage TaxID=2100421 RepID=A0A6J5L4V6_9CAUD|nr:hypothetical protein UFOVP95_41 [uncultured Caudovirales phage]